MKWKNWNWHLAYANVSGTELTQKPRKVQSNSDASSIASVGGSYEVEDFSPPSSPEERVEGFLEKVSGPHHFEPMAHELPNPTRYGGTAETELVLYLTVAGWLTSEISFEPVAIPNSNSSEN